MGLEFSIVYDGVGPDQQFYLASGGVAYAQPPATGMNPYGIFMESIQRIALH